MLISWHLDGDKGMEVIMHLDLLIGFFIQNIQSDNDFHWKHDFQDGCDLTILKLFAEDPGACGKL